MFKVIISNRASRTAKRLTKQYKKRLMELILTLRENPVPADYYDIKKLKGEEQTYRVRIGKIRVIYEVKWRERVINVLVVEQRGRAYS